jgi:hypothetical protein
MNNARLSALVQVAGRDNISAPISCPYTFVPDDGFRGRGNSDQECFLAAMTIVFEGGQAPNVTPDQVADAKEALTTAQQNAVQGGLAGVGGDDEDTGNIAELQRTYQRLRAQHTISIGIISGAAAQSLIDLIACEQVRTLTDKNMENFFKMKTLPDAPAKANSFVRYWASQASRVTDMEGYMVRAEVSEFVRYHTGASTTADLMTIAIQTPPFPGYFTEREMLFVERAKRNRQTLQFAREIPQFAIVKARLWLVGLDRHPDTWYMGKKAEEKFPATHYKLMGDHLKQMYNCIKRTHAPQDGADTDLPTLVEGFNALLASFHATEGASADEAEEYHEAAGEADNPSAGESDNPSESEEEDDE